MHNLLIVACVALIIVTAIFRAWSSCKCRKIQDDLRECAAWSYELQMEAEKLRKLR